MAALSSTFGRIKVGAGLAMDGVAVLRNHPRLAVLPAISGVASLAYLLTLLVPAFFLEFVGGDAGALVALFLWYFGTAFIAAFFNGALVHATGEVFEGKEPSLGRSLRAAAGEVKLLLVWAFASAVVGILLRALENSNDVVAGIVRTVVAMGWTAMTFFVIPVIVFEEPSIREMFGESGRTFRKTWGEAIGVGAGVTLTVAAGTLLALVVVVGGALALGQVGPAIVLALAILVLGYLAYATVWGVVKTALYGYAKTGKTPEEFQDVDFGRLEGSAD